jgi:hypothetical protein
MRCIENVNPNTLYGIFIILWRWSAWCKFATSPNPKDPCMPLSEDAPAIESNVPAIPGYYHSSVGQGVGMVKKYISSPNCTEPFRKHHRQKH